MHPSDFPPYWRKTRSLAIATLAVTLIVAIAVHILFQGTSEFTVLDFPLDYYLAAHVAPLLLIAVIVWHTLYQRVIEREHDVIEDD